MSDTAQGPGWWQASDGRWYPPSGPPAPAERRRPSRLPWVLVLLALAFWIAPPVIATVLNWGPEGDPEGEVLGTLLAFAWLFLFIPVGVGLMVAAWLVHRRTRLWALVEPGSPQRRVGGGCLSSAVPLAAVGVLTVGLWALSLEHDWRVGLLAAAPSVAAVVVAVVDRHAAQRAGAPRSWDLLALGIGTVTLLWFVAVVLGATWPGS